MLLADTNILSTFAKINELTLLSRLFGNQRVGVVPAVYAEFQAGVNKGLPRPSGSRQTHPTRAN